MCVFSTKYSLLLLFVGMLGVTGVNYYIVSSTNAIKGQSVNAVAETDLLSKQVVELERKMDVISEAFSGYIESVDYQVKGDSAPEDRISNIESDILSIFDLLEFQLRQLENLPKNNRNTNSNLSFEEKEQLAQEQRQFIDSSFQSEPVDQLWASGVETEFGELFNKPNLQAAQIRDIDCRSTMCRAELAVDKLNKVEEGDFENHLLIDMMSIFKGGVNLRREITPTGEVIMTAYLVKEGHRIPNFQRENTNTCLLYTSPSPRD